MNPWIIITVLAVLGLLLAILKATGRHTAGSDAESAGTACGSCDACNAAGTKCLEDRVMEDAVKEAEYFDDEELDAYKGRRSDSYTDKEAAEFAEVLYTMRPDEVKDWSRSLSRRGISLPDQIKDEVIMLIES